MPNGDHKYFNKEVINLNKKHILLTFLISLVIIFSLNGATLASNSDDVIILGDANWPGIRAKNAVVKCILENIGYNVKRMSASDPMIRQALTTGDIDIYLGPWMPSLKKSRKKNMDKYHFVTTNMHQGLAGMAVPEYVYEQGVTSLADLDEHAEKFDKKFYTGPAGWIYDQFIRKAIKNDIYGLGDWEIVTSNKAALMAQIEKSINNQEWICYGAWKPHWMNIVYNTKYLDDPESLFSNIYSWVDTLTRTGFPEDRPQVTKFLKQFIISAETNSTFSYEIGYNEQDPDKFAREWIKNNIYKVSRYLSLVEAKNGKPAIEVLKKNLNIN